MRFSEAQRFFSTRVIAYRPELIEIGVATTIHGCLLASQILYLLKENEGKPISRTDQEMAIYLGLGAKNESVIKTARKDLLECGAFTYTRAGIPARGFYDINPNFEVEPPENPVVEPVREISLTSQPDIANKSAKNGELSICIESKKKEEEQPGPLSRQACADLYKEQVSKKVIEVYNAHKPKAWAGKEKITSGTWNLISFWLDELGDEKFFEYLEKSLKYAQSDTWWAGTNLSLEALLRKTKNHLVELAEKHGTKPARNGRGYTPSEQPKTQKLKAFTYSTSDDLF